MARIWDATCIILINNFTFIGAVKRPDFFGERTRSHVAPTTAAGNDPSTLAAVAGATQMSREFGKRNDRVKGKPFKAPQVLNGVMI